MPVPQPILDALDAVQADADAVAAATTQAATSAAALAAATTQAQNDAAAVTAAQQHEATDLAALQQLLSQTYGTPLSAGAKR
jgi:hypothetical protein